MTALEILERARELIARPGGWTRYAFRQYRGNKEAFCAMGALRKVSGWRENDPTPEYTVATEMLAANIPPQGGTPTIFRGWRAYDIITDYNDAHHDKRYVLRAFDRAIKKLKAAE